MNIRALNAYLPDWGFIEPSYPDPELVEDHDRVAAPCNVDNRARVLANERTRGRTQPNRFVRHVRWIHVPTVDFRATGIAGLSDQFQMPNRR